MNLPAGEQVEVGIDLKEVDLRTTMTNFFNASLNGYLCLLIEGYDGLEEGVLVFKAGHPVAASYEYLKHGLIVQGEPALARIFNASLASLGVVDVFSVTKEQIDLVVSFNAPAVFKRVLGKTDIDSLVQQKYSEKFALESVGVRQKPFSRHEVLKKYKLEAVVQHRQLKGAASS